MAFEWPPQKSGLIRYRLGGNAVGSRDAAAADVLSFGMIAGRDRGGAVLVRADGRATGDFVEVKMVRKATNGILDQIQF